MRGHEPALRAVVVRYVGGDTMRTRLRPLACLFLAFIVCGAAARSWRPPGPGAMALAAQGFLGTLGADLRVKAVLPFDGPERTDWHFVPRSRPGVNFGDLNDAQRAAAHALLRSAMSSRGYLKVTGIMELETVLRDMESNPE